MAIHVSYITPGHRDVRGGIARIVDQTKFKLRSVLWTTSKAKTIRSNHYHKKDNHYLYVESGKCECFEKPAHKKMQILKRLYLSPVI